MQSAARVAPSVRTTRASAAASARTEAARRAAAAACGERTKPPPREEEFLAAFSAAMDRRCLALMRELLPPKMEPLALDSPPATESEARERREETMERTPIFFLENGLKSRG